MKVLNCPHCGYPPLMQTYRGEMIKMYHISCTNYVCNMPYYALGRTKTETIESWNDLVNKEKENEDGIQSEI